MAEAKPLPLVYYVGMSNRLYAKISVGLILFLALVGGVAVLGTLSATEVLTPPRYMRGDAVVPELSAQSWIVFDEETGEVLYEHNPDEVLSIASVTKLFTAASFLDHGDLAASTTIKWGDVATEGRSGKLAYGETYTNRELLFPLLLESSNDAATALNRIHPSLLEEIQVFNEGLSLEHTVIADPSGLSDENVSTARELSLVARYLYREKPEVFDMTRISSFYSKDNGWINNNPFVGDEAYRGGKHGFTYEAGRTVVAFFDEKLACGSERTLGYVILKSANLERDMELLRDFLRQNITYR